MLQIRALVCVRVVIMTAYSYIYEANDRKSILTNTASISVSKYNSNRTKYTRTQYHKSNYVMQ